jgi:hypothetical protein
MCLPGPHRRPGIAEYLIHPGVATAAPAAGATFRPAPAPFIAALPLTATPLTGAVGSCLAAAVPARSRASPRSYRASLATPAGHLGCMPG